MGDGIDRKSQGPDTVVREEGAVQLTQSHWRRLTTHAGANSVPADADVVTKLRSDKTRVVCAVNYIRLQVSASCFYFCSFFILYVHLAAG